MMQKHTSAFADDVPVRIAESDRLGSWVGYGFVIATGLMAVGPILARWASPETVDIGLVISVFVICLLAGYFFGQIQTGWTIDIDPRSNTLDIVTHHASFQSRRRSIPLADIKAVDVEPFVPDFEALENAPIPRARLHLTSGDIVPIGWQLFLTHFPERDRVFLEQAQTLASKVGDRISAIRAAVRP